MLRYYVEFANDDHHYLYLYAYSAEQIRDMFRDYKLTTVLRSSRRGEQAKRPNYFGDQQ